MPLQFVADDGDLPLPINTSTKQEARAKALVATHYGITPDNVNGPSQQGNFSRTRIVTSLNGKKIVIQFRTEPLEIECFERARELFGDNIIPSITKLCDKELEEFDITVYGMSHVPGRCWWRRWQPGSNSQVQIAKSLGTILGKGRVPGSSTAVIDSFILSTLQQIYDSLHPAIKLLRPHIDRLLQSAVRLRDLPLYFSHYSLHNFNVLVNDEETAVTGIVDWELARELPFGVGLWRLLDNIVAQNCHGEIEIL